MLVQTLLLDAAKGGTVDPQALLATVLELEKQKQLGDLATLHGEWRLLWTSGTKRYRQIKQGNHGLSGNVIQRIDTQTMHIDNEVYFSGGSLCVGGKFAYTEQKRIQFTFTQLRLQLGSLPVLPIPMGNWAKGWLQTTYLDPQLHIERGDRGGISVYTKI